MGILHGFDVSNNNPNINFGLAHKLGGMHFCLSKVSEGSNFADVGWVTWKRRAEAKRAGMRVGAYHFAHMGSVQAELQWFLKCLDEGGGRQRGDLPCVIDFEYAQNALSPADNAKWLSEFSAGVRKHTGRGCILYSYTPYLDQHLATLPGGCGALWIAGYPTFKTPIIAHQNAAKIIMHQYSGGTPVSWSANAVDLNVYYGNSLQMALFCR